MSANLNRIPGMQHLLRTMTQRAVDVGSMEGEVGQHQIIVVIANFTVFSGNLAIAHIQRKMTGFHFRGIVL